MPYHVIDRHTPKPRLRTLLLSAILLVVIGVPARTLARVYEHLDALSASVRSGDVRAAAPELDYITAFYRASQAWGLQWFGDYLLADAFLQRAAVAYMAQDYDTVVTDLDRQVDDPRAAHLLGCAKFRIAQRRYREIRATDAASTARKEAIIREVQELVHPDFERAVRADSNATFAYKWNYDLTSNAEAIRRAFEVPRSSEPPELDGRMGTQSPVRRRRG